MCKTSSLSCWGTVVSNTGADTLSRQERDKLKMSVRTGVTGTDQADDGAARAGTNSSGSLLPQVHRLRDLNSRQRWVAVLFATALLVAPIAALVQFLPDWTPANDNAVIASRALDVGTERTPLVGQPSTAGSYVLGDPNAEGGFKGEVNHLGPIQYYILAPVVRSIGAAYGLLLVSAAINGMCLLITAWAVFRQLGTTPGVLAAMLLAAVTFTTGAASLIHPVNAMLVGYPLLCTVVLAWCLLCRDLRLLPLAAAVASFTAQQHLSVLPTLSLIVVVAVVGLAVGLLTTHSWRDPTLRRQVALWGAAAALIGFALWLPPLIQQVTGNPGNLAQAWRFAGSGGHNPVGLDSSIRQVTHVLGLPPVLGQQHLDGYWFLRPVSFVGWVSAAVVLSALAALGLRWRRSTPRRMALVATVGIMVVAGLVNGSSMPDTMGVIRMDFYHWVWPLVFLAAICLALGLVDLLGWLRASAGRSLPAWSRVAGAGVALVAIVVPPLINPTIDRWSNSGHGAGSPIERRYIEQLADQVMEHGERFVGPTVVLARNQPALDGYDAALGLELTERGVPVQYIWMLRRVYHDDRIVDRDTVQSALVLVLETAAEAERPPGELIGQVETASGFARDDYEYLVNQIKDVGDVLPGPEAEELFASADPLVAEMLQQSLDALEDDPRRLLLDMATLEFLRDGGLAQPDVDPDRVQRVIDTLPTASGGILGMRVYLLDRQELLGYASNGWDLDNDA
jgi:hypothetical protein